MSRKTIVALSRYIQLQDPQVASTQNLLKEFRSIPGQSLVHSRLIDILVPMQKFKILVYLIFFLVYISIFQSPKTLRNYYEKS